MPLTTAQLTTELQTDPLALGYAAKIAAKDDAGCAALLNARTGPGAADVFRTSIPATELQAAIAPAEFSSLTALNLAQLTFFASGGVINSGAASVRTILAGIFAGAPFALTRAALILTAKRTGSRAEVLGGYEATVSHTDVAQALGRG